MTARFEYMRLDLNSHTSKQTELDLLDTAGDDGWQLQAITPNHFAYFMRAIEEPPPVAPAPPAPAKAEEPVKSAPVVKRARSKSA